MSVQEFDYIKIVKNGWKQGSCLIIDHQQILDKNNNPLKKGLYIIISQDCDVVNSSLDKEPFVEILFVTEITEVDGSLTNGKNPRILHFLGKNSDLAKHLQLVIHEKYFLPREHLVTLIPEENISLESESLEILIRWLANRYTRTAFPDAFNLRVRNVVPKIKTILKQYGNNTYGLFVRLNTYKELDSGEIYKLFFYILFNPKHNENSSAIDEFDNCLEKISQQLSGLPGVEVIQSQRLSIDDISHFEYLKLKKWDFDYISYAANGDGEILSA